MSATIANTNSELEGDVVQGLNDLDKLLGELFEAKQTLTMPTPTPRHSAATKRQQDEKHLSDSATAASASLPPLGSQLKSSASSVSSSSNGSSIFAVSSASGSSGSSAWPHAPTNHLRHIVE